MENRDIYFRGINKNGKWHYGDLVHDAFDGTSKNIPIGIREKIDGTYSYPIEVIPETVGQFTGLLDKNGTKIFEGDKVIPYFKNDNGHIPEYFWVVKYHDCYFYMESINRTPNVIETMFDFSNIIVIGTIHDHLLKGE